MKRYLKIACGLMFSMLLMGCPNNNVDEISKAQQDFLNQTQYGVYADGSVTFAFDESSCQIAYNAARRSVRLQKDDMSAYVIVTLDSTPVLDATVTVDVQGVGITKANNVDMNVVKTDGDKVWLWDNKNKTGYVIYWEL